jgi:putative signal transducing protein
MPPHVSARRKDLEEVFRTNDLVKLSYIRHLLSEAGIEPFVLDEHTAMIDGRGPMIPIRITVREDLADQARRILRDVERDA